MKASTAVKFPNTMFITRKNAAPALHMDTENEKEKI